MEIFLALVLGTLFGFVLHRVGASNPENIINMLRLKDLHLMKTILLAIGIASAVLFIGLTLGLINPGHISIKESYWGVLVGGMLLGAGWAIAGYCPGTGLVALGDGRKDAVFFTAGGLLGAFIYMLVYANLEGGRLLHAIAGGKSTLAATPTHYPALLGSIPGLVVALALAMAFMAVAFFLPDNKDSKLSVPK
ncbi:MAG: hypothetical protein C0613_11345 [Desulfobulbaceae bacterium]|nr:MAG: hypothetical protein C0613_11345 [Desulfobulbaceae bacterium]